MKAIKLRDKRIADEIRKRWELSEEFYPDDVILKATKGTLFRAGIEIDLACQNFKEAVGKEIRRILDILDR